MICRPRLATVALVLLVGTGPWPTASRAAPTVTTLGAGAQYVLRIDATQDRRPVPPGVVGWGAMWKRDMLWPAPPDTFDDARHARYIAELGDALHPFVQAADLRHISWPWGVSFSTWAVNWENSVGPWSTRKPDCVRLLGRTSPWCETTIVGVADLLTLAARWRLEALTVAVPLAVVDGNRPRWGPHFVTHVFDERTMNQIVDHARRLIDTMRGHPGWRGLERVYLAAGCEWRHYSPKPPSKAVLSYAELVRRIRAAINDPKVIVVASASDSADLPGIEASQATSWNRYVYEALVGVPGIALDLHRYRGMVGLERGPGDETPLTPANVDRLIRVGVSQRDHLTVDPRQWGERGPAMPTVLLENAIHGLVGDHATTSDAPWPWPAVLAHADLTREALAGESLAYLGWTWFPERLPKEWPHGALRNGQLSQHARAQAFLTQFHRGSLLAVTGGSDHAVRGNATRTADGLMRVYGGNFSRTASTLGLEIQGPPVTGVAVELFDARGTRTIQWNSRQPLPVPPLTLWRVTLRPGG